LINKFFGYKAKIKEKRQIEGKRKTTQSSSCVHPKEIQDIIWRGGMIEQLGI